MGLRDRRALLEGEDPYILDKLIEECEELIEVAKEVRRESTVLPRVRAHFFEELADVAGAIEVITEEGVTNNERNRFVRRRHHKWVRYRKAALARLGASS